MIFENATTVSIGPGLPIGAITTFGGDLSNREQLHALESEGWLLCDGSSYSTRDYPELFAAIGHVHGGNESHFNVPDLIGRFLRGTLHQAKGTDPDAKNRLAAAPGGATGNTTGSLQKTATGLPSSLWSLSITGAHHHTCGRLTANMHRAWSGSTHEMARGNQTIATEPAGAHFHTLTGFDTATLPINVALYFVIKCRAPEVPAGILPAGTITAFGGPLPHIPAGWLHCDGKSYACTAYPALSDTILGNFGGDGLKNIHVPDLRGYFLRGTSHLTNRDPDADSRHALHKGGNTGDNIGSVEYYATASPPGITTTAAGAHSHQVASVPVSTHTAAKGATGFTAYNCIAWIDDSGQTNTAGEHLHTITGGDLETRPENIYADFLIAERDIPAAAPPIGTIMPFGGDITDRDVQIKLQAAGWFPCDGSSLRRNIYRDLFNVIGTHFGGAPLTFALPDLRGYFVTGAGKLKVGTIQVISTTGLPVNPIRTTTNGKHTHAIYRVPAERHAIDPAAGWELAAFNAAESATSVDGEHRHAVAGGDRESRPINVNVDYIIRFR